MGSFLHQKELLPNQEETTSGSLSSISQGSSGLPATSQTVIRHSHVSPAHASSRVSLIRLSEVKRAHRCRFFHNGDKWFGGVMIVVGGDKHRSWESLLADLTRILNHSVTISGVRFLFTLEGIRVNSLDQLYDGGEFVASSLDAFKPLDYRKAKIPQWKAQVCRNEALHVPSSRMTVSAISSSPRQPKPMEAGSLGYSITSNHLSDSPKDFIRPKLVTIIRNGVRPRKAVRILLNRRTARSLEQVFTLITESIKLDSGAVRKVFRLNGHQVNGLQDFFYDDDVFIAYGPEKFLQDDLDLDSEECKTIQPLVKSSLSSNHHLGSSPVPRTRALSPLVGYQGHGSLPRPSRKGRSRSPYKLKPVVQNDSHNSHSANSHLGNTYLPQSVTKKYVVGSILGDGNFAVVHECRCQKSGEEFALKIIDKAKCLGKEHMIDSEVAILRKVCHKNIVRLWEELHTPSHLFLVMELVRGGDLFDAIARATMYTEKDASGMIRDLTSALDYLHQRNIVHRDIKPENLLIVDQNHGVKSLKLGDFGLAVEVSEPLLTVCGTPTYVAPEILAETGYGLKVDIWAAGVIMYILLCGFPPFVSATNNQEELFDQILRGNFEFHAPYWDDISDSAKELIVHMIQVDVDKRFTAQDVLDHPWIADDDALDQDLHVHVTHKLALQFDTNSPQHKAAGISIMTMTALDKKRDEVFCPGIIIVDYPLPRRK